MASDMGSQIGVIQAIVPQLNAMLSNIDKIHTFSREADALMTLLKLENSKLRAELMLKDAAIAKLEERTFLARQENDVFEVGEDVEALWWNEDPNDFGYIWCTAKIVSVGETVKEMFEKNIKEHDQSSLMVKVTTYHIKWTTGEKQQTKNRVQWDVRAPQAKHQNKKRKV